jgi:hypothetical protein
MTRTLKTAALMFASYASIASAQPQIEAENLLVSPPPGFKVGFRSDRGNRLLIEMIPAAETVEDWTQMLLCTNRFPPEIPLRLSCYFCLH